MSSFIKETVTWKSFELLIDTKIFPKDIILKASYNFLDKGYFFFKHNEEGNIILEFSLKADCKSGPRQVIWEFSDELLDVYLRDKLEKDNRIIRETIVNKSLLGPLEVENYVSHDPSNPIMIEENVKEEKQAEEINFDKDIDEIIKEIENDPDLQIDEDEIQQMLKEIEEETANEQMDKPTIKIDTSWIQWAKEMFKKK